MLILAIGHAFYGRMAFNLAVSIKANDPEVKIALGFHGDALKELFRYDVNKYVDQLVPIPDEILRRRGHLEPLRAKLNILELSPFQDTLYLDADLIWLPGPFGSTKSPNLLMDQLEAVDLAIQNRGSENLKNKTLKPDALLWASASQIREAYNLNQGKLYNLFSELMWVRRTVENELLFAEAREINDNLLVDYKEFAGGVPDELPLTIAMAKRKTYPHAENFIPVYWEHAERLRLHNKPAILNADFFAYSTGGKVNPEAVHLHYNHLADSYYQAEGLQYPYHLINKRDFLPERKNI